MLNVAFLLFYNLRNHLFEVVGATQIVKANSVYGF